MGAVKTIYDKVTLVIRKRDNMAYLVNPNDENMLNNARKWATTYCRDNKPDEYTIDNGNFELSIVDSADRSCQGGKLSFWTCKLHDKITNLTVNIGISAESLCELIKHNTFKNGKCSKPVYLIKSTASASVLTDNMVEFKSAKIVKSDSLKTKRLQTDTWKIGKVYETNTGKNPLLVVGYAIDGCARFSEFIYADKILYNNYDLSIITATCDYYGKREDDVITYGTYDYYRNKERITYNDGNPDLFIVVDLEKNGLNLESIKNKTLLEIVKQAKEFEITKSKKRVEIETDINDLLNNNVTLELHNNILKQQRETYNKIVENSDYTIENLRKIMYRVSISKPCELNVDNIKAIVFGNEKQSWIEKFACEYNKVHDKIKINFVSMDDYIENFITDEKRWENREKITKRCF